MSNQIVPVTYAALREEISRALLKGRERAQQAVDREKTQTYWEVGRLLYAHVLTYKERAGYGEQVVARLAEDVGMRERLLYEMLELYRAFPILPTRAKLGWSHYRTLLRVPTQAERRLYLREATRSGWSVRELEDRIKADAFRATDETAPQISTGPPLTAKRGRLYTYRLIQPDTVHGQPSSALIDLGFGVHLAAALDGVEQPGAGTIVESVREGKDAEDRYRFQVSAARRTELYTYRATVVRVVDGDTLWVEIDCGFRVWVRQKLRLRGIDAPELHEGPGRRAGAFVEQALAGVPFVALTTTKPDKYDRYLSDLFYLPGATDPHAVLSDGLFLNQQLLDQGLAVRFEV